MPEPVAAHGDAGWLGAIGRIFAFVVLTSALTFVLSAGYSLLPRATEAMRMAMGAGVIAAAALIAGAVLIRGLDGRSPAALGIGVSRHTPALSGVGLAIGIAALGAAAVILVLADMLSYHRQGGTTAHWVRALAAQGGVFAVAALAEEAIFRGYAFQVLLRSAGAPVAIAISSVGFAAVHSANPAIGVLALMNIFFAGIVFGLAYLRTLSLWFVTALHLGWNWAMATLFDLPVSGIETFDTPLYEPIVRGPAWLTGGEFGPEGGLVGTLGFALALAAVLGLRVVLPDPGVRGANPLVVDRRDRHV